MFGIKVESAHDGHNFAYHVANKTFEIAELKLLIDAIQASKFITEKKSNELIRKLTGFASKYEADQLNKQVVVTGRIKTMNESIYVNVDAIQNANAAASRSSLFTWTGISQGELVPRKKEKYFISPYVLMWNSGITTSSGTTPMIDHQALPRRQDEPDHRDEGQARWREALQEVRCCAVCK